MLSTLHRRERPVVVTHVENDIHVVFDKPAHMVREDIFKTYRCGNPHIPRLKNQALRSHGPIGDIVLLKHLVQSGVLLFIKGKVLRKRHQSHLVIKIADFAIRIEKHRRVIELLLCGPVPVDGF